MSTDARRRGRMHDIQRSCFGVLIPTQTISGSVALMMSATSPVQSSSAVPKAGVLAPTIAGADPGVDPVERLAHVDRADADAQDIVARAHAGRSARASRAS